MVSLLYRGCGIIICVVDFKFKDIDIDFLLDG